MSRMTLANSRFGKEVKKKRGKSIMELHKFELFGMQKACQRKAQFKPADQDRIYHKSN